jgi:putative addiction module component (TIGR02574 family)
MWQTFPQIKEYKMSTALDVLEAEALQLTPAERASLAEKLIASLDSDPEVEEAWAAEAERRNVELERGAISLLPGPETLAKLKADFQ